MASKQTKGSCESCTYFTYDEDYESYVCDINMDEKTNICVLFPTSITSARITAMVMNIWL